VLPLDQAEELFHAGTCSQPARFVKLLAQLIGRINATDDESGDELSPSRSPDGAARRFGDARGP
jgi:hypothetical protein